MKLQANISRDNGSSTHSLVLPASYDVIEDALNDAGSDETVYTTIDMLDDDGEQLHSVSLGQCNLFELNYLATQISDLEYIESFAFAGGSQLLGKENLDIANLINLGMNIKANGLVECSPASNDQELGEYYLTSDLIPALDGMDSDQYQWLLDHADLDLIGKEIREREGGVFVGMAYVSLHGQLEQLYDNSFRMPLRMQSFQRQTDHHQQKKENSMYITVTNPQNGEHLDMHFPCDEETIQMMCDRLSLENTAHTQVLLDWVPNCPALEKKTFKVDELNYLAKVIEAYTDYETQAFQAVATGQRLTEPKDFINLAHNINCYSVISDFSDLDKLGRNLYRQEHLAMTQEQQDTVDGRAYIENLVKANPNPMFTPYGMVYINQTQSQEVYQGQTIPVYFSGTAPIQLFLRHQEQKELVSMPCLQSGIDKALERLDITLEEAVVDIRFVDMPDNVRDIVLQDQNLDHLNHFAQKLKELGRGEMNHLSELVAFTEISSPEELDTLIDCIYEFELYPEIKTNLQYGIYMICESGRFEYDSNLEDYIDFEGYGRQKVSGETGVFTPKGYLLYQGYNQKMEGILHEKLGLSLKVEQPLQQMKLYMPLKVVTWQQEGDWGMETSEYEEELHSSEICGYEKQIQKELALDSNPKEQERGLMAYYRDSDAVNAKVKKYVFDVEEVGRNMMGVAVIDLHAPLTQPELKRLKDEITGQAADGLGESLEQRPIMVDGREVFVSLWNSQDDWSLQTAQELGIQEQRQEQHQTFEMTLS